jgi:hypothetical protein
LSGAWEQLALFESTDLVSEFFERRHRLQLSRTKARQIVSHIAQGREYFTAAHSSGELVRPLLQYYGALSLARGTILFRDPALRDEASLAQAHGLIQADWSTVLSAQTPTIGAVTVRTTQRGTFAQFAAATRNEERIEIGMDGRPTHRYFRDRKGLYRERTSRLLDNEAFTLKELLARVPDLKTDYENTYGEQAACYPAIVVHHEQQGQTDMQIYAAGQFDLPSTDELRRRLSIPSDVTMAFNPYDPVVADLPYVSIVFESRPLNDVGMVLPPMQHSHEDGLFVVEPLDSGVVLAPPLQLFAIAYSLGMIARYHPTSWLGLLSRQAGDRELPLLRATSSHIQTRFPEVVWQCLEPSL